MGAEQKAQLVSNNKALTGGEIILPWKKVQPEEIAAVAHYPDHGRPIAFGSLLRNNPLFLELARELHAQGESQRINDKISAIINGFLDRREVTPVVLVPPAKQTSEYNPDLPEIRLAVVGSTYEKDSIRIYHYLGTFNGEPAFYQLALVRKKDAVRVEKEFLMLGYQKAPGMDNQKASGHGRRNY